MALPHRALISRSTGRADASLEYGTGKLNVAPIELCPFRLRDPRTGKWVRARYVATRAELESRYREWEIIGPPEIRGDAPAQMFQPALPAISETSLELQPHLAMPPRIDAT